MINLNNIEVNDQFKLACQIANEIDRLAITRGAEIDLFGPPKINEMVRSDPASFAPTLEQL